MANNPMSGHPKHSRGQQRAPRIGLYDIVVMAAISIVFGVLYLLWIFFGQFVQAMLGPVAWGILAGMWVLAPIICAYIIRKPGIAFIAELIAAGTEVLAGSVNAGVVMLLGLTQGLGAELAFALFRYRNYRLPVLMLAGILGMFANFITIYFVYGYDHLSTLIVTFQLVAMLISGAVMGGWGGKAIADALGRTGVLNRFALGKELREESGNHGLS